MGCYGKSPKVQAYFSSVTFLFSFFNFSQPHILLLTFTCFTNSSGETEDTFIADLSVGLATVSSFLAWLINLCFSLNCYWNTYQSSKLLPPNLLSCLMSLKKNLSKFWKSQNTFEIYNHFIFLLKGRCFAFVNWCIFSNYV